MKGKEQQQLQIQQMQMIRQAQLQQRGSSNPNLSGAVNVIGSENGILGQSNASAMATKMYEECMKHSNPMDVTSQPILDAQMPMLKPTANHHR